MNPEHYETKLILDRLINDLLGICFYSFELTFKKLKLEKEKDVKQVAYRLIFDQDQAPTLALLHFGFKVRETQLHAYVICNDEVKTSDLDLAQLKDQESDYMEVCEKQIAEILVDFYLDHARLDEAEDAEGLETETGTVVEGGIISLAEEVTSVDSSPVPDTAVKIQLAKPKSFLKKIRTVREVGQMTKCAFEFEDNSTFGLLMPKDVIDTIQVGDFVHYDGEDVSIIDKRQIQ